MYKFVNRDKRQVLATKNVSGKIEQMFAGACTKELSSHLSMQKPEQMAVVITGQYTNEEYEEFIGYFKKLGVTQFYHWINNADKINDFDGVLFRGDHNPNTKGLIQVLSSQGVKVKNWNEVFEGIESGKIKTVVVAGPEVQAAYPELENVFTRLNKADTMIWLTAGKNEIFEKANFVIPVKSFTEKNGTFVNFNGKAQKIKKGLTVVSEALTLSDFAHILSGKELVGFESRELVGGML
jgi:NADH-quinone oxidoreductase subunit G